MKRPDPKDYTGQFGDIELLGDQAVYVVYLEEEVRRYQRLNACSIEQMNENQVKLDANKDLIKTLQRANVKLEQRSTDYLEIYRLLLKHHPAEDLLLERALKLIAHEPRLSGNMEQCTNSIADMQNEAMRALKHPEAKGIPAGPNQPFPGLFLFN